MTNSLHKLYENMLKGSVNHQQLKSITDIYEQTVSKPLKAAAAVKPVKLPNPVKPTPIGVTYDDVIARALGEKNRSPKGDYKLGVSKTVDASDMEIYRMLYPVAPPKSGEGIDAVGTKGSGNGEIALYWLLSKRYPVVDNRDAGKPDLEVTDGRQIGVEVKAYDTARMGLGRFGDQRENRALLSIIFGIHALLKDGNSEGGNEPKSAPSIDSFNRHQLVASFTTIKKLIDNKDLRSLGYNGFQVIKSIYDQIDFVLNSLKINPDEFTPQEGAAKMLLALLATKLAEKPGFNNFIINMTKDGKLKYHRIPTEEELYLINPEKILNFVNANSAALIIKPDEIFKSE